MSVVSVALALGVGLALAAGLAGNSRAQSPDKSGRVDAYAWDLPAWAKPPPAPGPSNEGLARGLIER